jgi:hypothetical protein
MHALDGRPGTAVRIVENARMWLPAPPSPSGDHDRSRAVCTGAVP